MAEPQPVVPTAPTRRNWVVIPPTGAQEWILRDSKQGTELRFATQREALRFALHRDAGPLGASVASR